MNYRCEESDRQDQTGESRLHNVGSAGDFNERPRSLPVRRVYGSTFWPCSIRFTTPIIGLNVTICVFSDVKPETRERVRKKQKLLVAKRYYQTFIVFVRYGYDTRSWPMNETTHYEQSQTAAKRHWRPETTMPNAVGEKNKTKPTRHAIHTRGELAGGHVGMARRSRTLERAAGGYIVVRMRHTQYIPRYYASHYTDNVFC